MTNMRVMGDNVLVQQDPYKTTTKSGLILPDGKEEYPNLGTVLGVGPKVKENLKVGDRVLFRRKPSSAISPDARPDEQYYGLLVLPEEFIIAHVTEEDS